MHMNLKSQFQVLQPDRENLIVKIVNKDAESVAERSRSRGRKRLNWCALL